MALQSEIQPATGMWELGGLGGTAYTSSWQASALADRSGNGRNWGAPSGSVLPFPDLRAGYVRMGCTNSLTTPWITYGSAEAAFRSLAAVTITCRLSTGVSTGSSLMHGRSAASVVEDDNINYEAGFVASGGDCVLRWRHQHGAGLDDTFTSTLVLNRGQEYFCAWRRASDGVTVTVTRGDFTSNTHESTTLANAPTGGAGANPRLHLGWWRAATVSHRGVLADVCLWVGTELTDDELETLRDEAMQTGREGIGTPDPYTTVVLPERAAVSVPVRGLIGVPKFSDLRGVKDVGDLARRCTDVLRALHRYIANMPRMHMRTLSIRALPVLVRVPGLVRPPYGVSLLGCYQEDEPSTTVPAYGMHWFWDGSQIQITSITGLTAGEAYVLSLMIVEMVEA